ncbi:MAG: transporter substrate-binding domain-containing protein [Bifidobacteriaceae bacterium]|jgi:putative lysine transport system substrate-binding protein|nr:transporter substrate-binding domain-containing protein [Bifidobacteriaceae bacterium]
MKKLSALIALSFALPLGLAACGGSGDQDGSGEGGETSKTLRVGMEAAYAPFNWTQKDDSNGAVKIDGGGWAGGYDVQMAKLVAQHMGREIVVVKTSWDGLIPALQSGKIDMIVAGMSPTEERKEAIDFSEDYYTSDVVIVVKKDSPLAGAKSLEDFKDAKITAQISTIHYDQYLDEIAGVNKQTALQDFPTMILAVKSGKVDGYISERPGALSAVASNPDLAFAAFEDGEGFKDHPTIAIGLKKGSDLLEDVNAALGSISEQQREQLMEQAVKDQPGTE